jgi:hypothetical protein
MTKLRTLQKRHPLAGDVRGLGLMIGVELIKDEKLTPATPEAEAIREALLRNGVLVGVGGIHGNVIRFQPPLIITRQQIDQAIEAFAAALQEVAQPAAVEWARCIQSREMPANGTWTGTESRIRHGGTINDIVARILSSHSDRKYAKCPPCTCTAENPHSWG